MTTPERGLFDEITEAGRKHHWRMEWETLKPITDKFEQRLAEAEAKYKDVMADLIFRNTDLKVAHDQVAQLRARCGELEKIAHKANAVNAHWNEFGHEHGFDERMDHLHSALTAAPQPAKEQVKCKNCNGKGWTWLAGAPAHVTNQYPCEICSPQEQTTK